MSAINGLDKQKAMFALTMDRSMSRAAIAVGHVLLDRYNLKDLRVEKRCYPSIEMIAAETLYDVRTVKAARKALRKAGYITWTAYGARYTRRCWYEINWPCFVATKFEHDRRVAKFKARRDALAKGDVDTTFEESASAGEKSTPANPENSKGDVHPVQRCRVRHPQIG
ncbi:MAG: helix-turn-helix domain-containing protein, partial [Alphaproteobacteria bacterium]|nr:helix-turn-helix domain-containing protein [Alphaproteobacteria bacterium]